MFERYTPNALRVIFFARYEASQFGAPMIEPEHVLLGILREERTLIGSFLTGPQPSLESVHQEIERCTLSREKISTAVEMPLGPATMRVLAYAFEESQALKDRHIGSEHLLLGLLREEDSLAADILSNRGLYLRMVRDRYQLIRITLDVWSFES